MSKQESHERPVAGDSARASDDKRRQLVKGAALGVGGITLTHWSRPVVESVVLPAHAQTTGPQPQISAAAGGGTELFFNA